MATDKTGVKFDPALHFSGKNGGFITAAGTWRKRAGSKVKAPSEKDTIAKLLARIEALEARPAERAPMSALQLRELQDALADLGPKAALPLQRPAGPKPTLVPYSGMVRSTQKCVIDHLREAGEVFQVSMPALWSDDPFEPVNVTGVREDGGPIVEARTDVSIIDWRFRVTTLVTPSVRAM